MAANKSTIARAIEFDSIKTDTGFYLNLILQLNIQKSAGILIFGLIPYMSLFTVETYKYLQSALPACAASLSKAHESIIRSSRMRTKLFDDKVKRVDGMFELLAWIIEFHNQWHINAHKGLLAPLKRALQDDLGIFVYDGHIIGSTHTGLLNLGVEKGNLPTTGKEISTTLRRLTQSIGEEIGGYIGQLSNCPELAPSISDAGYFAYNIQDEKLGYRDEKSKRYFASVFNGANTVEVNFSLILFLATVNFFEYILRRLIGGSPSTMFKLKFIMLHHFYSSIEKLRNYYYPKNLLTERSKRYFQAILEDRDLKLIRTQSGFRNILVHYRIDGVPDKALIPTASLYGLVEHFFAGQTYNDVDKKLDSGIARISSLLEEWLNWRIRPHQTSKWQLS